MDVPVSKSAHVFVSSRDENDKEKVKISNSRNKNSLSPYEEIVDSADADRLYFLKQHTLVTELIFDETQASYRIKGFKNYKKEDRLCKILAI